LFCALAAATGDRPATPRTFITRSSSLGHTNPLINAIDAKRSLILTLHTKTHQHQLEMPTSRQDSQYYCNMLSGIRVLKKCSSIVLTLSHTDSLLPNQYSLPSLARNKDCSLIDSLLVLLASFETNLWC
jgi:hypothetical protein